MLKKRSFRNGRLSERVLEGEAEAVGRRAGGLEQPVPVVSEIDGAGARQEVSVVRRTVEVGVDVHVECAVQLDAAG